MPVFKDFPGLENLEKNSRTFKDLQGPARALSIDMRSVPDPLTIYMSALYKLTVIQHDSASQLRLTISTQHRVSTKLHYPHVKANNDNKRTVNVTAAKQELITLSSSQPAYLRSLLSYRAPSSKKRNFRTKFLENFRTLLSVSRGSRHRKCTFFCPHKC